MMKNIDSNLEETQARQFHIITVKIHDLGLVRLIYIIDFFYFPSVGMKKLLKMIFLQMLHEKNLKRELFNKKGDLGLQLLIPHQR